MFKQRLLVLESVQQEGYFKRLLRGVEKENLRVTAQGKISIRQHPKALGAALTNSWITTDYSEALIEVVTPATTQLQATFSQLQQVSQFVAQSIGDEIPWASSMPVPIAGKSCVPLAKYGNNNAGRLKTIYRRGLCHRYGRPMQVIAGLHYNLSFPVEMLNSLSSQEEGERESLDSSYMRLVRNCFRHAYVLPYLFGASPACASSSVIKQVDYVRQLDSQSFYSPYGTSLRLSDLGYQNKGGDLLNVNYDNALAYANSLKAATQLPYSEFEQYGIVKDGEYQQLSTSLLQIANEYYSIVRPKQVAQSGERATQALIERGVAYVELRMLDLNPLQTIGICPQQMAFMDVFATYCLLADGSLFADGEHAVCLENIKTVAAKGRQPGLKLLQTDGGEKSFVEMAKALFDDLMQVAELMSASAEDSCFVEAVQQQQAKLFDVDLTPSAEVLNQLVASKQSFLDFHLNLSQQHADKLRAENIAMQSLFEEEAARSLKAFHEIESSKQQDLSDYFKAFMRV
jgi:glutamate--cysteine ligase